MAVIDSASTPLEISDSQDADESCSQSWEQYSVSETGKRAREVCQDASSVSYQNEEDKAYLSRVEGRVDETAGESDERRHARGSNDRGSIDIGGSSQRHCGRRDNIKRICAKSSNNRKSYDKRNDEYNERHYNENNYIERGRDERTNTGKGSDEKSDDERNNWSELNCQRGVCNEKVTCRRKSLGPIVVKICGRGFPSETPESDFPSVAIDDSSSQGTATAVAIHGSSSESTALAVAIQSSSSKSIASAVAIQGSSSESTALAVAIQESSSESTASAVAIPGSSSQSTATAVSILDTSSHSDPDANFWNHIRRTLEEKQGEDKPNLEFWKSVGNQLEDHMKKVQRYCHPHNNPNHYNSDGSTSTIIQYEDVIHLDLEETDDQEAKCSSPGNGQTWLEFIEDKTSEINALKKQYNARVAEHNQFCLYSSRLLEAQERSEKDLDNIITQTNDIDSSANIDTTKVKSTDRALEKNLCSDSRGSKLPESKKKTLILRDLSNCNDILDPLAKDLTPEDVSDFPPQVDFRGNDSDADGATREPEDQLKLTKMQSGFEKTLKGISDESQETSDELTGFKINETDCGIDEMLKDVTDNTKLTKSSRTLKENSEMNRKQNENMEVLDADGPCANSLEDPGLQDAVRSNDFLKRMLKELEDMSVSDTSCPMRRHKARNKDMCNIIIENNGLNEDIDDGSNGENEDIDSQSSNKNEYVCDINTRRSNKGLCNINVKNRRKEDSSDINIQNSRYDGLCNINVKNKRKEDSSDINIRNSSRNKGLCGINVKNSERNEDICDIDIQNSCRNEDLCNINVKNSERNEDICDIDIRTSRSLCDMEQILKDIEDQHEVSDSSSGSDIEMDFKRPCESNIEAICTENSCRRPEIRGICPASSSKKPDNQGRTLKSGAAYSQNSYKIVEIGGTSPDRGPKKHNKQDRIPNTNAKTCGSYHYSDKYDPNKEHCRPWNSNINDDSRVKIYQENLITNVDSKERRIHSRIYDISEEDGNTASSSTETGTRHNTKGRLADRPRLEHSTKSSSDSVPRHYSDLSGPEFCANKQRAVTCNRSDHSMNCTSISVPSSAKNSVSKLGVVGIDEVHNTINEVRRERNVATRREERAVQKSSPGPTSRGFVNAQRQELFDLLDHRAKRMEKAQGCQDTETRTYREAMNTNTTTKPAGSANTELVTDKDIVTDTEFLRDTELLSDTEFLRDTELLSDTEFLRDAERELTRIGLELGIDLDMRKRITFNTDETP